jgi:protein-tyrosine phosphatase
MPAWAACLTGGTRTELHFHLLPGVDDGPRDLDEALALAQLAVEDGTAHVVCTPHVQCVDVATLPARVRELRAALRDAAIALEIAAGAELRAGARLTSAELEIVAQGPPGSRWVLLEAPLAARDLATFHAHADDLGARGYGVLIGHPERCAPLMAPGGGLDERLRRGALLQVNASSITGAHGERSRAAGADLVARGLVTALSSDAHGSHRPPLLRAATALLAAQGVDAGPLTAEGPSRLVREGFAPLRARPAA